MHESSDARSTVNAPRDEPSRSAERLQHLWDQGQQPDVDAFLANAGMLSPTELASVLRVDQRQRWLMGQRVPAEAYMQRHPSLRTSPDAAIDLIYNEYLLHEKQGTAPPLDDFVQRFPEHAATLKQQIELHQALARDASRASTPSRNLAADPPSTYTTARPVTPGEVATATFDPVRPVGAMPRELGRYRIVRLLGRGGMGEVYQAHDTELERMVALKVLPFGSTDNHSFLQRFQREARAAAKFTHPHLCPVYDVGMIDGIHYLTMPFIPGQSLALLIRQAGPLPELTSARWAAQIARALQSAHAAGVIHRDLKPSNIMINERHEPVVIDFGLALRHVPGASRLTPSGGVMGTPAYLAPELAAERPGEPSPAADVYALGVILYEMLTGQVPFQGSVYETLKKIIEQDPVPPSRHRPGLNPKLEVICLRAMHKLPAERYPSMAALAVELEACSGLPPAPALATAVNRKTTVAATAAGAKAPAAPQRTKRWTWLAIGAAGLTVLGIVVAIVLLNMGRPVHSEDPRDPEAAQALVDRAWEQNRRDKYDLAIQECDLALKLDDRCVKALVCRAYANIQKKQFALALADLDRAVSLDPDYYMSYVDRAWAFNEMGETAKALQNAHQAVQLKGDDAEAYYQRGWAYISQKQYALAIADFSKAIALQPDYAWAYHQRALAYDATGASENADKDRAKAVKLNPGLTQQETQGDPLQAGSRWKGDFLFREPIKNYSGDVLVIITERTGNAFKGEYATENGKWHWKIKGIIDKQSVSWDFTDIIKETEPRTVVGTAKVRATLVGSEMKAEFYIPNTKTVADVTLRLQK